MYGSLLPAWDLMASPGDAMQLYEQEIASTRQPWGWGESDDYYSQNWVWFGVALWNGLARPPEQWQ